MRIIQVVDSLNPGGLEKVALNYFNLLEGKIEGSFLCVTRQEGLLKEQIKKKENYIFLKRKRKIDFKAIYRMYKFIKINKITHLHAHGTSIYFSFIFKILLRDLNLIYHDHLGKENFSNIFFFLQKLILKNCKIIIVVNNKLLNLYNKLKLKTKVKYLKNFILYDNKNSNSNQTKLNGFENKRIIILANLRIEKNHLFFLKVFKKVLINNINYLDWTVHLIGKDFNDDYSKLIKKFIDNNNLSKNVFIYGSCIDIKNILNQSDIGILCSISEGLPLSLLEYGLAKLPVICTNVGECGSIIKDNINGYLIPSNDEIELLLKLEKLILDKSKRDSFSLNLNNYIKLNFNSDLIINSYLTLLNE